MDPKTTSENLFNYLEGGQEDQIIEDPFKEHALIVYAEKPGIFMFVSLVFSFLPHNPELKQP